MNFTVSNPGRLSDDQWKAAKDIEKWYKSNELVYCLYGAAGTGKTYLLNYLLRNVFIHATVVTAPTHKAVKVVESVTGRKGKTFQSLLGLRPNVNVEDFDIDNIKFDALGTEGLNNYKLVIVDECSQVINALHRLTTQRAKQYNTKILYLGDALQLPPIKERLSPTFSVPRKFELTQIVRQEESNPLLKLFKYLRDDICTNGNKFLTYLTKHPTEVNDKGEGYICLHVDRFSKEIINVFKSKEFEQNPQNYVRYAAYTNTSVNLWNMYIRDNTVPDHNEIISVDDLLTGYKTIVDEYNTPIIINSEDYVIESLSKRKADDGFDVFIANMTSLLDGRSVSTFIVDHKSDTFAVYKRIISELRFQALYSNATSRGKNWRKYFEYKDRFLTLIPFSIRDHSDKETFVPKDLDYGYGLTVHKLQGSTVNHIFVNLLNICYYNGNKSNPIVNTTMNPYAIETRNKLIYTALSRAKKIAILLV